MRRLLGLFLLLAALLAALWTTASLYLDGAERAYPLRATAETHPQWGQARAATCLSRVNRSLWLNPCRAEAWELRSRLCELNYRFLPESWKPHSWEKDLMRAIGRTPAGPTAWLPLALACAAGNTIVRALPSGCHGIFTALLERTPLYGWARFRYADYLYGQSLAHPKQNAALGGVLCRQYALALKLMGASRLLSGEQEKRAIYNCFNAAPDYQTADELVPINPGSWDYWGRRVISKGYWPQAKDATLRRLREDRAPLAAYQSLAAGLAAEGGLEEGALVLRGYLGQHLADGEAWEALVRYLDAHPEHFGRERMIGTLGEALAQAKPAFPSTLFFITKSCHADDRALTQAFYARAVALDPAESDIYTRMAYCEIRWDHLPQAIDYYRKAVELAPKTYRLRMLLGKAYARNRQVERALEQFQQALDLKPGDAEAKREMRRIGIY